MTTLDYRTPNSAQHKKYLEQAMKVAELSEERYRHGAVLRKSGRTLSVGINRNTNDPMILDQSMNVKHFSIHAEYAAIRAVRKSDLQGASIYIARVSKNGEPVMSKPCVKCQKMLKKYGVKKVYYTIDNEMDL